MKFINIFIYILLFIVPKTVSSQNTRNVSTSVTLPVVALLDIEPAGTISMNFRPPTEAGLPLTSPVSNTTKWMNYTSAIRLGGLTRRVTASVNQVIPGVDIKLQASSASGLGGGVLGVPSAQTILTTTPVTIISGIGGAFTGSGQNNGHRLTVNLSINNYSNLTRRTNTPIIITYTITE